MHRLIVVAIAAVVASVVIAASAGSADSQPQLHRVTATKAEIGYLPLRPNDPVYAHLPPQIRGKEVVVDISDFTLYELEDGITVKTLPVSTGKGGYYHEWVKNHWASGSATTQTGTFSANKQKIDGRDGDYLAMGPGGEYESTVGRMDWPVWIVGNSVAIHGEDVPYHENASHGCIRIPWDDSPAFYNWAENGMPVIVQQ